MVTEETQSRPFDKSKLFELAKRIYALHRAINQLANIAIHKEYRENLIKNFEKELHDFRNLGGIAEIETDFLGERIPILSYTLPKEIIPYDVGRLDCEKLLSF